MKTTADTFCPGSWLQLHLAAVIVLTLSFSNGYSQIDKAIKSSGEVADAAELVLIAVDIIEATSYTADKLKTCKQEIDEVEALLKSPSVIKYMADRDRREWAKEIRQVSMNVQLYATLLTNTLKRLKMLEGGLGKEAAKSVTDAIQGVTSVINGGSGSQAVVNAVDDASANQKKATLESNLVSILLKLDDFNKSIDKLVLQVRRTSESIGNQLGYNLLVSMPNRSIKKYAERRRLNVK